MKSVSILSTGSELIHGNVQDSNSAYISSVLFATEFQVVKHITVGDTVSDLESVISEAVSGTDITIITGGLGSTDDDNTFRVLQSLYGLKPIIDPDGANRLTLFFESMGRKVLERDLLMVTVPEQSIIFRNDFGLSPGFALDIDSSLIIVMPGVPGEMRPMFDNRVLPFLFNKYNSTKRQTVAVRTILMRESAVNDLINTMKIPFDNIDWGITTTQGMNEIRFIQKKDCVFDEKKILFEAQEVFGNHMLLPESENIESEVVKYLSDNDETIAIAESCTGGLVAKRLTDIPGSSSAFMGSIVAYSNQAKYDLLDVSRDTLENYGAVSEEVAGQMARGVRERFNTSIGVSTTGIAGPDGGTDEKPVGLVCFGIAINDSIDTFTERIMLDRERVRFYAAQYILDRVRMYFRK